jgi:hypothetical protein
MIIKQIFQTENIELTLVDIKIKYTTKSKNRIEISKCFFFNSDFTIQDFLDTIIMISLY